MIITGCLFVKHKSLLNYRLVTSLHRMCFVCKQEIPLPLLHCILHFQCYYIGASDISATKLVREITKPLSFGKPTEKICEALKKKDEQICELRYGENTIKSQR